MRRNKVREIRALVKDTKHMQNASQPPNLELQLKNILVYRRKISAHEGHTELE